MAAGNKLGQSGSTAEDGASAELLVLCALGFTVQLGMGIISPILPEIMRDFSLSAWQIGMMITVFGLARLVTDLPLGLLLERIDRTRILAAGTLLIAVGSIASGLAADYTFLLGARLVMGIGSAFCTVTALFSVSRAAGAKSRGRAIGIYQAAVLAGTTFSPMIGGLAATVAGWRAPFFFCAFTGAMAMLLVMVASGQGRLKLPSASPERKRPEAVQTVDSESSRIPWALVAINFTTFIFFLSIAGFRNSMVPIYGGNSLGIGAGTLGLLLGGTAIIRFGVTIGSGFASDRFGRKVILVPGTIFLAAGTLGFILATNELGFVLSLLVISLGGFGNSVPTTMVVDTVPPGRVGMAISMNRFVGDAGILVGPVLLGWILDMSSFSVTAVVTAAALLSTIPGVVLTVRERRQPAPAQAAGR